MNDVSRKTSEQVSGKPALPKPLASATFGAQKTNATNDARMEEYQSGPTVHAMDVLRAIINNLAVNPETVDIDQDSEGFTGVVFTISAPPTDAANITGGGGRNLQGIQAVIALIGRKANRRFRVTLGSDKPGEKRKFAKPEFKEDWRRGDFEQLLEVIFGSVFREFSVTMQDKGITTLVEVFVARREDERAVQFLSEKLGSLIKAIGYRFSRSIDLVIVQDQMLYEQTLSAEKKEAMLAGAWNP